MRQLAFIAMALLLSFTGCAQRPKEAADDDRVKLNYVTTPEDSLLALTIMDSLKAYRDLPTGELMVKAGTMLLGQPYVAGTLDERDYETTGIFLTRTDCIIFVETVFNLAQAVKMNEDPTFLDFACLEQESRYRNAVCENYSDRIHYTTEWIRNNESRGLVKDITLECGGETFDDPIDYMSTHFDRYTHLKDAETDSTAAHDLKVIKEVENTLNEIPLTYIPEDRIEENYGKMKPGDILGLMSGTKGLDIAHVTMYIGDGRFMHASMGKMKVVIDEKTVADYVKGSRNIPGIKVIRPL